MKALIDTSAYSAFKRGVPAVVDVVRSAESLAMNAIVLGELLAGFRAGGRETANRRELRELLLSPRVQVVAMGSETAEHFSVIHQALRSAGTPIPTHDLWIAASAMEHGLRVITTDEHFRRVPTLLVEFVPMGPG